MNRYKFTEVPHCHWLDGKPLLGTTTILDVISKELTWWASGMAVGKMGWLHKFKDKEGNQIKKTDKEKVFDRQNERIIEAGKKLTDIKFMTIKEYLDLLDEAYKAHNEKKTARAQEGTDIHLEVETYINAFMETGEHFITSPRVAPFIEWCEKNVKRFLFSEIHCYSESLWVGGKTDFGYEDMDGNYVLADVKSREGLYFSDFVQCGGYDILLSENRCGFDKDGNRIWDKDKPFSYHAMFPVTEKFTKPFITSKVTNNQYAFISAIQLYKLRKDFEEEYK